jgi:hypothetical protein
MGRRKGNFLTYEEMQELMKDTRERAKKSLGLMRVRGLTACNAPIYRWVDHMGRVYFYELEQRFTF